MFLWRSLRPDAVSILLKYLTRRAAPVDGPGPRGDGRATAAAGRRPAPSVDRPTPAPGR